MSVNVQVRLAKRRVEMTLPPPQLVGVPVKVEGAYLVATNQALFLVKDRRLILLLKGNFYGIARTPNSAYVYQSTGKTGRLLQFQVGPRGEVSRKARIVVNELPGWCHQIDFLDDSLFLTDTPNNRILELHLPTRQWREHFPLGMLKNGMDSPNYGHMNSIYRKDGRIYVICHNQTAKTGRKSEILVLDREMKIQERLPTESSCAHNIVFCDGQQLHLDSLNQSLKADGSVVFSGDYFTRGLSVSDDAILVGGSTFAKREERQNKHGYLYALNRCFDLIDAFLIPGMVQEIRRMDRIDYTFSQTGNPLFQNRREAT